MLALSAALLSLAVAGQTGPAPSEGWTPLFNGRNLDGWYTFLEKHGKDSDPEKIVTIEDNQIHLYKHAEDGSRVVMGYISTDREYGDYHFRLKYRWGAKKFEPRYKMKRDAGLYYHIIGPDKVWPRALQFQIERTNVGDLITLYGIHTETTIDPKTRSEKMPTFLPAEQGGQAYDLGGQGVSYLKHLAGDHELEGWNTVEVIARGATTTHLLNGRVVARGKAVRLVDPKTPDAPSPVTRGRIALEIEAAELFYRDVEIRSLPPEPERGKK